jgi:hypothetical protein
MAKGHVPMAFHLEDAASAGEIGKLRAELGIKLWFPHHASPRGRPDVRLSS